MTYGTPEFYSEQFADILADVDANKPEIADNILKGLELSIEDWLTYHEKQAFAYAQLRERVRKALAV
jgi:hypothetical protein